MSGDDSDELRQNKAKYKKTPAKNRPYKDDEGLIGLPTGNRVEDRLMNQGKMVQDKKLFIKEIQHQQHTFKPNLNMNSLSIAQRSRPATAMTARNSPTK